MSNTKLRREFYQRKPQVVAKELLGKLLARNMDGKFIIVKIVETEAYGGEEDKGCHASRYGVTKRTAGLFGEVGHAYIYPVHINMFCFNAVAHEDGKAGGVLIRAGEPLEGTAGLLNGPAKLCKALKINSSLNGEDLLGENLFIVEGEEVKEGDILATKRVNIPYAGEARNYLWRYVLKNSPFLSRPLR
mgnify:CR=1 FL=1